MRIEKITDKHILYSIIIFFFAVEFLLCTTRLRNPGLEYTFTGDYKSYTTMAEIVANGTSLYDPNIHWFHGNSRIPLLFNYAPLYIYSSAVVRLVYPSSWNIVVSVIPMVFFLISVALILTLDVLSDRQKWMFLLAFSIIYENGFMSEVGYIHGESLGVVLCLVGTMHFLKERYVRSTAFLALSVLMNFVSFSFIVVLGGFIFIKKIFNEKTDVRMLIPVFICTICLLSFTSHFWFPRTVTTSKKPGDTPFNMTLYPSNPIISGTARERGQLRLFLPGNLPDMLKVIIYPVISPIWSEVPQMVTRAVCGLFEYNLTYAQIARIYSYNISLADLFPISVALSFGVGMMFLLIVGCFIFIEKKDINDYIKLVVVAYTVPIMAALFNFIFGFTIFPYRFLMPFMVFLSLYVATAKAPLKLFCLFGVFFLFRDIIWIAVMVGRGGL